MTTLSIAAWPARSRTLFPGRPGLRRVVAAASTFLSQHYGAPVMLFALMLGHGDELPLGRRRRASPASSSPRARCCAGASRCWACASPSAQVAALGWHPVLLVVRLGGADHRRVDGASRKLMGFQSLFGLLSGGATAICGASAALALAAALPAHPQKERATLFTVVGVSALSTLGDDRLPDDRARARARRARGRRLPRRARSTTWRRWSAPATACRSETGDVATFVKLHARGDAAAGDRVRRDVHARAPAREPGGPRPPLLPWFAVAFAVLVAINSTGWIPKVADHGRQRLSRAGAWWRPSPRIGMKTQLKRPRHGRPQAGAADARRDGVPRRAGARAACAGP